jgi:hypothetical protein
MSRLVVASHDVVITRVNRSLTLPCRVMITPWGGQP